MNDLTDAGFPRAEERAGPHDAEEQARLLGVHRRTYRLLRNGMPVLLLWLVVAMAVVWWQAGRGYPMTSISAYYYTDAQPFFVAVLIALGALLIVIQGQTPWEDALMNTAGALSPLVALLPTPVSLGSCRESYCTVEVLRREGLGGAIPNNHELIAYNLTVATPIWLLIVVYFGWRLSRASERLEVARRADRPGTSRKAPKERGAAAFSFAFLAAFGGLGLGAYWWSASTRDVFYDAAHLTSAVLMVLFLLVSIVCFSRSRPRTSWASKSRGPRPLRRFLWLLRNWFGVYLAVALVLIGACVVIVVVKPTGWNHAVLVVSTLR